MGPSAGNTGPVPGFGPRAQSTMSDAALEFAEERGLGKVESQLRLGSGITIPDGSRARASLLLSTSGLWLVAAKDRFHGVHVDLLTHADLRLSAGRFRDRLCFAQEELAIPTGRRNAVERLIALARLASPARLGDAKFATSRFVHRTDELGRAWLLRELEPGEVLIAWLQGSNRVRAGSHLVGETACQPYLFLTDRRAAIAWYSAVGDLGYAELREASTQLRADGDKVELRSGEHVFTSRRSDAQGARDVFELLGLEQPKARLLEAARRLWLGQGGRSREDSESSLTLLDAAITRVSQRARFARLCTSFDLADPPLPPAVNEVQLALSQGRLTPSGLSDLWARFRASEAAGDALVRGLLECGAPGLPFALALQRRVHSAPTAEESVARSELRLAHFATESRLRAAGAHHARDVSVLRVLGPRGLGVTSVAVSPPRAPLPAELIEGSLSHPLARGQGSLVASAQKLIAQTPEPDHAALSDYCEALDSDEQPAAKRALDAARLAFSLPSLHAYVSRGKKSIGLRGYEGKSPYILLGKAHLDASSPFRMSEAELHFAIGAEALHLKLGQARLTSNEVWAGAFARTKGGVELVLTLLPLLKGLPLAISASKYLEKIPEPALRRGLDALLRFERTQRKAVDPHAAPSVLSHVNENLVAAHRLMQMSADRAGLLLSGDLQSSLRALLLVRPDTRTLLDAIVERDLVSVLIETEGDSALRADLVVRVAALLDFYVAEEYATLRHALCGA